MKTFSSNLFQSSVERIYNDANKNISSTNAGQRCWKKLNDLKIEQSLFRREIVMVDMDLISKVILPLYESHLDGNFIECLL
ncbi:hypothetical protein SFRURICE_006922 [Spodoptera frugiperda]|nr:hypothetical protein SFRURICE_006922 [Spodoptera frugiperda]